MTSKNQINFHFARNAHNTLDADNLSIKSSTLDEFLSHSADDIIDQEKFNTLTDLMKKHAGEITEVTSLPAMSDPRKSQKIHIEFSNDNAEDFANEAKELGLNPQP